MIVLLETNEALLSQITWNKEEGGEQNKTLNSNINHKNKPIQFILEKEMKQEMELHTH